MRVLDDGDDSSGEWEFSRMGEMELYLVGQIPNAANPGDDTASRRRLFPGRATVEQSIPAEEDEAAVMDWREYVVPELERAFSGAVAAVRSDLEQTEERVIEGERFYELRVPADHADHWYSALNQARLVLAEKHDFPAVEEDFLEECEEIDQRWLACAQSHIYAVIQTFLLEHVMGI